MSSNDGHGPVTTAPASSAIAAGRDRATRRVAGLAGITAVSLWVASGVHLAGLVHGRSAPFNADHAGIAEAVIGVVLAGSAVALARAGRQARRGGLFGFGFAIAGFCVGLAMTTTGGHWPDIVYHLTMLPLLVAGFVTLLRLRPGGRVPMVR